MTIRTTNARTCLAESFAGVDMLLEVGFADFHDRPAECGFFVHAAIDPRLKEEKRGLSIFWGGFYQSVSMR